VGVAVEATWAYDWVMPKIEAERSLTVPAIPSRSAISSILHDIADQRNAWADFALYCSLGSLGLPDVGYLAVPVRISGIEEQTEPRHEIRFQLQARRSPEAFPEFDGAVGIDATGPSNSSMWLAGNYEVPLHGLGTILNHTLMRGLAEKTLNNMLDMLRDGVIARVENRELADSRYRLFLRTGD
jgi:hypothetical protein